MPQRAHGINSEHIDGMNDHHKEIVPTPEIFAVLNARGASSASTPGDSAQRASLPDMGADHQPAITGR
jgi:hypothetical protein